jgi:hypothetical protein
MDNATFGKGERIQQLIRSRGLKKGVAYCRDDLTNNVEKFDILTYCRDVPLERLYDSS